VRRSSGTDFGGGSSSRRGSESENFTDRPDILYEIDRLSLDKVAIFPDGELKVTAMPRSHQPGPSVSKYHPR
jgi:hypothetical protein